MRRWTAVFGLMLGGLTPAVATSASANPYAGWEERPIKALSPEQIRDLRAGRGMGLALAAELNGYPGPLHVLDSAEQLELSAGQRHAAQALFEEMQAGAMALGEQIIAGERLLEHLFAAGLADEARVRETALELGRLQGELRAHHLRYHIAMRELLTPQQVARYQELRGYGPGHGGHAGHH